MRKLRRVVLCEREFIVKNKTVQMRRARFNAWSIAESDKDDIFRKYRMPSSIKLAIWRDWCYWAEDLGDTYLQVRGANPNFFSIEGLTLGDDNWYYVEITHGHNYLYPIEIIDDEIQ